MPTSPYSDPASYPTVETYLRNPARVQRDLEALTYERFVADYLFSPGDRTENGAVLYNQLLAADVYTERDVQEIEELSQFPVVNVGERQPSIAIVRKWGGAVLYSDEKVRRDRRDLLGRDLRKLANTVTRKVNRIAVNAFTTDPQVPSVTATAVWSDLTNSRKVSDLIRARGEVNNIKLGYQADTVLIHPQNAVELAIDDKVINMLPREAQNLNPILSGTLSGLLSMEWIETDDVPEGTIYVLARRIVGSMHDELPFYSRVVPMPMNEATLIQAARVTVPVVTDPKAVVKLTGV